jgi:hypothetical protein
MENNNIIRIIILEDDLETLSVLMKGLYRLELKYQGILISPLVFSEYNQVEKYVNKMADDYIDIILLDRDCKIGGSFHVLDFERFNKEKIISISAIAQWNDEAVLSGASKVFWKDHDNLEDWAEKLMLYVKQIVNDKVNAIN